MHEWFEKNQKAWGREVSFDTFDPQPLILKTMSKGKDVKKETKKQPVKSAKEKKAEKRDKKPKYD